MKVILGKKAMKIKMIIYGIFVALSAVASIIIELHKT